jgi:hypothetical protein
MLEPCPWTSPNPFHHTVILESDYGVDHRDILENNKIKDYWYDNQIQLPMPFEAFSG